MNPTSVRVVLRLSGWSSWRANPFGSYYLRRGDDLMFLNSGSPVFLQNYAKAMGGSSIFPIPMSEIPHETLMRFYDAIEQKKL